ncbi:MAG: hypothetical protein O7A67_08620 [SAR324 cluster bacterium]|nr:hypothetical protein [SAR324 cluster bacterium]MCZ6749441.1 hypothetical protein [SAR324 cluster bacterium]
MSKRKNLTHQELQDAIQQFMQEGGMIAKLPEQKQVRGDFVGSEKYDDFEPLSIFLPN